MSWYSQLPKVELHVHLEGAIPHGALYDLIQKYGGEKVIQELALDRMTEPEDIAPLAVLLASGLADHATGTSIDVNAGSYVR